MPRKAGTKNVDERLRNAIVALKALQPDWSASQIRNQLMAHQSYGLAKFRIPQPRAIQHILKVYKPQLQISLLLEQPWSLGTLSQYPVANGSIPVLLVEQAHRRDNGTSLSIRQARWIARLLRVPTAKPLTTDSTEEEVNEYRNRINLQAIFFSTYEIASEVTKMNCDTTILDAPSLEEIEERTRSYFGQLEPHDALTLRLANRIEKEGKA